MDENILYITKLYEERTGTKLSDSQRQLYLDLLDAIELVVGGPEQMASAIHDMMEDKIAGVAFVGLSELAFSKVIEGEVTVMQAGKAVGYAVKHMLSGEGLRKLRAEHEERMRKHAEAGHSLSEIRKIEEKNLGDLMPAKDLDFLNDFVRGYINPSAEDFE